MEYFSIDVPLPIREQTASRRIELLTDWGRITKVFSFFIIRSRISLIPWCSSLSALFVVSVLRWTERVQTPFFRYLVRISCAVCRQTQLSISRQSLWDDWKGLWTACLKAQRAPRGWSRPSISKPRHRSFGHFVIQGKKRLAEYTENRRYIRWGLPHPRRILQRWGPGWLKGYSSRRWRTLSLSSICDLEIHYTWLQILSHSCSLASSDLQQFLQSGPFCRLCIRTGLEL